MIQAAACELLGEVRVECEKVTVCGVVVVWCGEVR